MMRSLDSVAFPYVAKPAPYRPETRVFDLSGSHDLTKSPEIRALCNAQLRDPARAAHFMVRRVA